MRIKLLILVTLPLAGFNNSFSQTVEHNGWIFWSHQQKITEKWQFSSDIQVRTANLPGYINTVLIRPGIGYNVAKNQTLTVGYTYLGTWEKENDQMVYEPENRIFEQYQVENKIQNITVSNRIRFEQRFFHQPNDRFFAQRFRYNIQAQFPLIANQEFTKGMYAAFQNELFLNIQGKSKINNHVFDQNRTYIGLGYRLNKKLDLETDYMFRYLVDKDVNVRNNVLQIAIKSSF